MLQMILDAIHNFLLVLILIECGYIAYKNGRNVPLRVRLTTLCGWAILPVWLFDQQTTGYVTYFSDVFTLAMAAVLLWRYQQKVEQLYFYEIALKGRAT